MTRDLHMNRPTPVSRGQGQEDETFLNKSDTPGDFPGGSMIKASCCQCRGVGSIGELRTHMPWGTAKRFFFKVILQDVLQNRLHPNQTWGPVTPSISFLPDFSASQRSTNSLPQRTWLTSHWRLSQTPLQNLFSYQPFSYGYNARKLDFYLHSLTIWLSTAKTILLWTMPGSEFFLYR